MVEMMKMSGYTCFREDTLKNFKERFYVEKSLPKVANKMQSKIYWANNSIFTNWYDRIQLAQQKIEY
jgi:phosphatidylinositol kinase/protein kinase (PI-3  family)